VADVTLFLRNVFNLCFIRLGRVFSNRSGEGTCVGTEVAKENWGGCFRARFFDLPGQGADTLESIWQNFFAYFLVQVLLCYPMIRSKPIKVSHPRAAKMKEAQMPGSKLIARGTGKHWILGGLLFSLLITIVVVRYGDQLPGLIQKDRGGARSHITGPATEQPFDERLSLRMPIPFGPVADYPLQKLPAGARGSVQKMMQRTAYFNGVYLVVMKMKINPETKDSIEDILFHTFSKSVSPTSLNMPEINSTEVKGVYKSGALRFPAVFGNSPGQMTVVVIQPGTADSFWCINAWGRDNAAGLAEKTAKEFTFK